VLSPGCRRAKHANDGLFAKRVDFTSPKQDWALRWWHRSRLTAQDGWLAMVQSNRIGDPLIVGIE